MAQLGRWLNNITSFVKESSVRVNSYFAPGKIAGEIIDTGEYPAIPDKTYEETMDTRE